MFDLLYLGTSASAPAVRRGLPSMIIMHNELRFMIDCGEGTQRQILASRIGLKKLDKILITHGHLDHILGLAGLLSTILRWETLDGMSIYGGADAVERIEKLLYDVVLCGKRTPVPLRIQKLEKGLFFECKDLTLSAFPVTHRGTESFGFSFEEKGHRPFLADKAEALHIPQGPWRKDLVNGKTIALPDGRTIYPEEVLGVYQPGVKLVVVGDTGNENELIPYAADADVLSIESTYLEEDAEMAHIYSHLTAKRAATLAKEAGVKTLILTHLSRRYRERDILNEAREIFPNTLVARDLDQYQIKQGEVVKQDKP